MTPTDQEANAFASLFRSLDGFASIYGIRRNTGETDVQLWARVDAAERASAEEMAQAARREYRASPALILTARAQPKGLDARP
jgi:hypothetical protein